MADADELNEDDLFADLYDGDEPAPAPKTAPAVVEPNQQVDSAPEPSIQLPQAPQEDVQQESKPEVAYDQAESSAYNDEEDANAHITTEHGFTGTVGIKEDGKMFIGGLNWETTDESLRNYFEQFGEVVECTVMRDGATGRSRGFGFLTFRDPKCVNTVMVKEHVLDNKIIDPKRAIPRDEQERTSKIFVGGVSQDATERDFENFFGQFGRVVDATLMMDKETGRPRGFGFVTFEGEQAVEDCLAQPLEILGKPIEVKRAQPRGNIQEEETNTRGKFQKGGRGFGRGGQDFNGNEQQSSNQNNQGGMMNMTPGMMAQYWARMQQYFAMMQQQMMVGGQQNNMMQQMMMMQQQQAMQQAQQQRPGSANSGTPGPQGDMNNMQQMQQQMQQMQQMQQQMQQGGFNQNRMMSPMNGGSQSGQGGRGGGGGSSNGGAGGAYSAQEQMAFEQRKYEQQTRARMGATGPTANQTWDGMYDDPPQGTPPAGPASHQGGFVHRGRGGFRGNRGGGGFHAQQDGPKGDAPANAPTGPKNAGRPGANYRGGGRGGHRGFHPYSRN